MKELFIHLVANSDVQSRSGVEVKQVTREQWQTEANGLVETAAYEWSAPGAQRRMPFMLSVASSETAQVYGTASIIREWGIDVSRGAVYVLLRCRRVCPCAVGGVVLPG